MLFGNKQTQEAGEGSQLMQAGTINVYNGIDESRAREIVDERLKEVINGYSQEAHEVAKERINQFVDDLIPKLVRDNLLESLSDPGIQILLTDAQKTAASTERQADYALLSELLIHRVKKGSDRSIRSGVNQAVKIVDEITDEGLLALTVIHSVEAFLPIAVDIESGLRILEELFSKVIYSTLPKGSLWMDQLDVLKVIRINPFGALKKIDEFYSEQLSGYVDVGIEKCSDNYIKATDILKKANLPNDIICDHELRKNYVRLRIMNINNLDMLSLQGLHLININGTIVNVPVQMQLSNIQKQAVKDVYSLYNTDESLKKENVNAFMEMWNSYNYLRQLREWWNSIQGSFDITSVGKVLAHANAQRCDPQLPNLN